jgi:hypothetical protein
MKGTIDQVDAFFEGITSVWTRVMFGFATCWAAHLLGSAAANFEWIEHRPFNDVYGLSWGGPAIGYKIYLLPIDWIITLIFNTKKVAGIPVILALVGFGYLMIFSDRPRLPLVLFALLIQSWWSWYCGVGRIDLGDLIDGTTVTPLPGLILMLTVTSLAIYLWRFHRRKLREEGEP